jgi:SAM-dependent methyltransferase
MAVTNNNAILTEVSQYYSEKLAQFGQHPQGVDWNGEQSQLIRFEQLCKIISPNSGFSVNDLGCGYGALLDYFSQQSYTQFSYAGYDVSETMIEAAKQRASLSPGKPPNIKFYVSAAPDAADYTIASGLFNVRGQREDEQWLTYIYDSLEQMDVCSERGFAFNCLTSYSDEDKKRDYLYYADPLQIFDRCKKKYAKDVALLHDYGLYEFTIIVRKKL